MKKRGQLYLLAAFVIAALIIGLGIIYNYARTTKEDLSVFDLSKEIDFETSRVLDRGVFKPESDTDLKEQIKSMTDYYADLDPRSELITLYGKQGSLTAFHYKLDNAGSSCIQVGGAACSSLEFFEKKLIPITPIEDLLENSITINLDAFTSYKFDLKSGEHFYIVLSKEKENEKFISAPERKI
jgi:hypothetical protein